MSDIALENAKALQSQANAEIQRLEAETRIWRDRLTMANQFIDQWNVFASGHTVNPVDNTGIAVENKSAPSQPAKRVAMRNSKKEAVAAAAREIIRERGEPIMRSDLYKALVARGLTIEGTDPEMVLSTMLWRMRDTVARVQGGGYWLQEVPNPAVGYHPADMIDIPSGGEASPNDPDKSASRPVDDTSWLE